MPFLTPGTNHDRIGQPSCTSNVEAIQARFFTRDSFLVYAINLITARTCAKQEASFISEAVPVQHNRLEKNIVECSSGTRDAATEGSVYGGVSEPPAVAADGEALRQKAIGLVVQGLLRALNTSDGNSSKTPAAASLVHQMYRVAKKKVQLSFCIGPCWNPGHCLAPGTKASSFCFAGQ